MCNQTEMYIKETNRDGSTAHSHECKMAFGRKDKKCHRCVELLNGDASREGWQKSFFQKKKEEESKHLTEIREHNCKKSGCGTVCTFGDWQKEGERKMNLKKALKYFSDNSCFSHILDISCPKCGWLEVRALRNSESGEVLAVSCTKNECDYIIHDDSELDKFFERSSEMAEDELAENQIKDVDKLRLLEHLEFVKNTVTKKRNLTFKEEDEKLNSLVSQLIYGSQMVISEAIDNIILLVKNGDFDK